MPELPWVKFFPSDWRSDPALAKCDAATRGIWMDAITAMMLQGRSYLSGTIDELAIVCRCRRVQMEAAIADLKRTGAANTRQQGVNTILECRRLLRELHIKELKRKAGLASANRRATDGQQTPQQTVPTPSEYASASASVRTNGQTPSQKIYALRNLKESLLEQLADLQCRVAQDAFGTPICTPQVAASIKKVKGKLADVNRHMTEINP